MRKLVRLKLKILAKMILAKYKPKIIGITGSVGKTSTKEAVYTVLKTKFSVRRNIKNYNNEIGLPLTIIGSDSPGKSIFGWIGVFFKALGLVLFKDKDYPKILVLEMGVDRPGDMKYLTSIARVDIGIVTLISHSHEEFFTDVEEIQKEKGMLIENLKPGGWAILNFDDELTRELAEKSKVKVLSYGFKEGAMLRAQELVFSFEKTKDVENLLGLSFKLTYNGSFVPVLLPQVIGYNSIYAALAAAAVGATMGMNLIEISNAMREFDSPNGRMNLIDGIKHTLIIDDTYNSSPTSVMSALDIITKIPIAKTARRFAVLGDMLELGRYSEDGHKEVGRYVAKTKISKLIAVGERARDIARGAQEAGMLRDNIFEYTNVAEAGRFIQQRILSGDLILVKGSQGMRMEKIIKELMAEPLRAKELLVRQEEEWGNNS
ncbi:MAG: UDP-N-acetylmuramoyl-tripeptide--D-alanyl-D-alanine ligase [Patescibacteria group bacterium]|nr:UDP-N-acetylmuramoyl-tripeptide--D-alanyl-D-alanine ligase [Patescibacteria group bacterium]